MLSGSCLTLNQADVSSPAKDALSGAGASQSAQELCLALLAHDRQARLGYPDGASALKHHDFFRSIDWGALEDKQVEPPFVFDEFPLFGRGRLDSCLSVSSGSPSSAAKGRVR